MATENARTGDTMVTESVDDAPSPDTVQVAATRAKTSRQQSLKPGSAAGASQSGPRPTSGNNSSPLHSRAPSHHDNKSEDSKLAPHVALRRLSTSLASAKPQNSSWMKLKHLALQHKARKRRDGTPDKSVSPNASQSKADLEELPPEPPKVVVIDGEDIQALAIKEENLAKLKTPRPPSAERPKPPSKTVSIKKMKPTEELNKPKSHHVMIARPAPPDAPLKPVEYTQMAGPRFDGQGNLVPHSILGTVEEFKMEAIRRGDIQNIPDPMPIEVRPKTPSIKYQKKSAATPQPPQHSYFDENNALKNWEKKMLERKRQQGYISRLLQKPLEHLVMNQGDEYRETQEERYLIERSIPAIDYGKGYRIGSEFWQQSHRTGGEMTGLNMTLTQTERGYPAPIEHVGHPKVVNTEMGMGQDVPISSSPINYPWKKAPYLKERKEQLKKVMDDLDPYNPDFADLQIIGSNMKNPEKEEEKEGEENEEDILSEIAEESSINEENLDPLRDHPDIPQPFIGPSLSFDGFTAKWVGDSSRHFGQVAYESRVIFEAFSGERTTAFVHLVNEGTTTLYYNWKQVPKSNPFDIISGNVQRFYFNTSSGVILPGDSLRFPFIFKSPNAGIFTETWQLCTKPVVCGGAALRVTLRGVALQEDKNKKIRNEIEREIFHKQAEIIVSRMLGDLVDGIRTPDRPSSPVDSYITDDQKFERLNPGLHYTNELVNELRELYLEQFLEEEKDDKTWNLSVDDLRTQLLSLEDEVTREEMLARMNTSVFKMTFPPFTPTQQLIYKVAYQKLVESVDNMVFQSLQLRNVLGLPEKEDDIPETEAILAALEAQRAAVDTKKKKKEKEEDKSGGKEKGKDAGKKGGKKDEKEKERPRSKGKQPAKAAAAQKQVSTPVQKDKELTTPSSEKGDAMSPILLPGHTPMSEIDPAVEVKYQSKLYLTTYGILNEAVSQMLVMFDDIQEFEDNKALGEK